MTAQTLGPVIVPRQPWNAIGILNYVNVLIDSAPEEVDMVFQIPKTGTISKIWFRTGVVTTGDTLKVGIYTVDPATGLATTTAYGGMVAGTVLLVASTDNNKAIPVTLGTACSATKGDPPVAVRIQYNSYVAGNLNIQLMAGGGGTAQIFPYICVDQGSGLGKTTSWTPLLLLEYSDGTFPCVVGAYPWVTGLATTSIHLNSTPDELALRFSIPVPSRLSGFSVHGGQGNDADFVCYGDTTVTLSHDGEFVSTTAARSQDYSMSGPTLAANTVHRMAVKATEATNTVSVVVGEVPSAAAMEAADGGAEFYLSERNDAGTWTDTTTKRPLISLHLDQFSDGAGGGGGGLLRANMSGGML